MDTSVLSRKADELRQRSAEMVPVVRRGRPMWQAGILWLAGGMAVAWLTAFFLDSRRGSARRHMAYDKAMATGRDVGRWSGKKIRHLRNKAMGTVAEMKTEEETPGRVYG
jgi:hypothetical protein